MNLEEFEEQLFSSEDLEFEELMFGDNLVELCTTALISDEYGLTIRIGTWCEKDENGEWYTDWSFTLIHKTGDDPSNYLYLEQGGIYSTLLNYSHMSGNKLQIDHLITQIAA